MLRALRTLLICILYGAVGTVLVRFLYTSYYLIAGGVERDDVPVRILLIEHVQAVEFAVYGAIGGLAFGLLVILGRFLTWSIWRLRRPKVEAAPESDPDAILRADRERRAEGYLASRAR